MIISSLAHSLLAVRIEVVHIEVVHIVVARIVVARIEAAAHSPSEVAVHNPFEVVVVDRSPFEEVADRNPFAVVHSLPFVAVRTVVVARIHPSEVVHSPDLLFDYFDRLACSFDFGEVS